jgi:hypothetical protein
MSALGQKQTLDWRPLMSALPPKADIAEYDWDVRFGPIKVMSEIRRLPLLRGSLTERRIVRLTPFSYLVGLLDVYRAFIAHADRQTTSQGSELRPYNWDISVEGERRQSRSCWRYSRRKKWQGLSSNSHWWSTLFGKSPRLALYDRQVAELRNQLYQR